MTDEANQIEFACQCGKKYKVSDKRSGRDMLCLACSKKITIPGERKADEPVQHEKSFDSKYLISGLALTAGGILAGLAVGFAFYSGVAGRGLIYGAIIAPILLVMGIGSLLKWMFGRHIEWD